MTETDNGDNHIKCSTCKSKYHNIDESIIDKFGFKRFGDRYKCCVKCRIRARDNYKSNAETICDNQYISDYEPCKICNNQRYKYSMKRHMEICRQYYEPRENVV